MPETDTPTKRSLRAKLLLCAASVVFAIGVAEVSLRVFGIARPHEPRKTLYNFKSYPNTEAWGFVPGSEARFQWTGDPYDTLPAHQQMSVFLNGYGLRGRDPPPGYPLVLFVGDSFTFGEGVELEKTFVRRVERDLEPEGWVCVNAGVPGFGSVQQATRLPHWLDDFKPRVVVLVYVLNDPVPYTDMKARDDDLMKVGGETTSPLRLLGLVRGLRQTDATENWYRSFYVGDRAAEWARARDMIADMKSKTEAAHAAFGVALFPLLHDLSDNPFGPLHEMVRDACREQDIPFLDLTPVLAGHPEDELWVHPADHHPNARAHELVSEPLAEFVRRLRD